MVAQASGQVEIWANDGTIGREDFDGEWQLRTAAVFLALFCSAPDSMALNACQKIRRVLRTCPEGRLGGWFPPQLYHEDPN
eukprot:7765733-Pyramimonas_sp.AAC.1